MNVPIQSGPNPADRGASAGGRPWIAIAALSENRVIGSGGRIPWHLPQDFAWFKAVTRGQILVMGRRTYESIGRPLPGRRTVVVSRRGFQAPGVETVADLAALRRAVMPDPRLVFVCGGGVLYTELLDHCCELLLTQVPRVVEGDAFFPSYEDRFEPLAEVMATAEFRVVHYIRRPAH